MILVQAVQSVAMRGPDSSSRLDFALNSDVHVDVSDILDQMAQ